MDDNARGEFYPTKVIVLSELPTREKEKYYQLLSYSNSKFRKDSEGRYIANVRLLAPNVKKIENSGRKKDTSNYSLVFQERLRKLKEEGFINVRIVGTDQFDYNSFPRFTALIAFNGDTIRPKVKPLSWVMKIVEDIYDHRFSHEKNDVEREEDSPSYDLMLLILPVFVVRRLGTNVGLKALVDQTCWDLAYNCHLYRRDYLELEVFGRFLQEFYDHDDLLFYLYVRSVIAKVLHLNFKTRWTKSDGPGRQPKSLWMSYRECSHVARIVFGTDNEDLYRNFLALITPQMVGQLTAATDSRRMDITEYLHLSVVGYHQSQLHSQQGGGAANGERLLVPLPGQTAPPVAVPNPDEESHYFDQNYQQRALDGAAAAAAQSHAAGGRSYSTQLPQQQQNNVYQQNQQHDDEQASYELDEEVEDVHYTHEQSHTSNHYQQPQQQSAYHDESPQYYEGEEYQQQYGQQQGGDEHGYDGYDDLSPSHGSHNELDAQLAALNQLNLSQQQEEGEQEHAAEYQFQHQQQQQEEEEEIKYSHDHESFRPQEYPTAEPHQFKTLEQNLDEQQYIHDIQPPVTSDVDHYPDQNLDQYHDQSSPQPPPPPTEEEEEPYYGEGEGEEVNELETLQLQREREFMAYLCDGLDQQVPPEYAQHIEADLSERLRQTVNIYLSDKRITDVDSLDTLLVEFLGLEQLRVDLESTRDELVEALMGQHIQYEEGHGVDDSISNTVSMAKVEEETKEQREREKTRQSDSLRDSECRAV